MKPFVFYSDKIDFKSLDTPDGKKYYVEGYISTGDQDLVNDVVTKSCMDNMLSQFNERTIKLDFEHESFRGKNQFETEAAKTRLPLGKSIDKYKDDKGVIVKWELNPDWKKFDSNGNVVLSFKDVWNNIKNKFLDAFSIAYVPTKTSMQSFNGKSIRLLDGVNLLNVALTGNPVNPGATMSKVFAKSLDYIIEEENNMEFDYNDLEIKSIIEAKEEELAELKAKYKRRWRGRDGKWNYEYGSEGKPKESSKKEQENESSKDESKTVAVLRNEAYDSFQKGDYEKAEKLYSLALEKYPKSFGELSEADKQHLKEMIDKSKKLQEISKKESSNTTNDKLNDIRNVRDDVDRSDLQGIATSHADDLVKDIGKNKQDKNTVESVKEQISETLLEYSDGDLSKKEASDKIDAAIRFLSAQQDKETKSNSSNTGVNKMAEDELKNEVDIQTNPETKSDNEKNENEESENEESESKENTEVKSLNFQITEIKSRLEELEKENKELKAYLNEPQYKSVGAEKKSVPETNEVESVGPLDRIR